MQDWEVVVHRGGVVVVGVLGSMECTGKDW
jgi:hypothetical protein